MSGLKIKTLAVIAALALPSMAVTTAAHAGLPTYTAATQLCPASTPFLIGYARFTGLPVCTGNPISALIYNFIGAFYAG